MHYLKYLLQPLQEEVNPADIVAAFSTSESFEETPDNEEELTDEQKQQKQLEEQQHQQINDFTPSNIWDYFKTDENFKMPENVTKDNEKELLEQQFKSKYEVKPVLHPLAQQIQDIAEKNPNVSINDILNNVQEEFIDLSKMTTEEKITFHLRSSFGDYDEKDNPEGLTKEDIESHISKLTKIERAALVKQIEANVEQYNKSITESFEAKQKEAVEANYTKTLENNEKYISELKTKAPSLTKIFGVPVSQEQHEAYIEEFKNYITPDKETGKSPMGLYLSDDVNLYKTFIALLKIGEEQVIENITKGREATKEEIFKKLGLSPTFSGTRDKSVTDDQESIVIAFGSPERN